jgi:hypothetical protein
MTIGTSTPSGYNSAVQQLPSSRADVKIGRTRDELAA